MFSDRMSGKELSEEFDRDSDEIVRLTLRLNDSEHIRKIVIKKRKDKLIYINHVFKVSSGNRYLCILLYIDSSTEKGKKEMHPIYLGIMSTFRGECMIGFFGSHRAIKMTPHFFERYRERLGAVCDWKVRSQLNAAKTQVELAGLFAMRNLDFTWYETDVSYNNCVHVFTPVNDGVVLVQWDRSKRILQANTFLTEDMLNNKQAEMVYVAREYLKMSDEERAMFPVPSFVFEGKCD